MIAVALLQRIARLIEAEAVVRSEARVVELDPSRRTEADRLFRRASGLRRVRLELVNRCGLA